MPFNGSGTFQRVYNWVTDKNNSVDITASRVDTEDTGFATGLTNCICKDGQTTITANLPMSGFRHTGVGNGVAITDYAALGQIQSGAVTYINAGGTANAQTLTPSPALASSAQGNQFTFMPVATNTSDVVSITTSGLAARNLKKYIGPTLVTLAVGDLTAGQPATIVDDGSRYILMNPLGYSHSLDIASATTTVLNSATGDLVDVTGTTTITAITLAEGLQRTVRFTGILTLTNGASLVLPGGANITTAAGDYAIFRGYASGVVRCVLYSKVSGLPTISSTTFVDSTFVIGDDGDSTKKIAFQASGITTGTTRTFTAPDKNGTLAVTTDLPTITVKGWAKFTGTTLTAGSGITSIANGSTGNYTVTLPTQADANYAPSVGVASIADGRCVNLFYNSALTFTAPNTTSFIFSVADTGNAPRNADYLSIYVIGN